MHFLYPENDWALNRVKDDPAHKLFKRFGESMPPKDWNHPGTKQGVYMMGPEGEYLEGGGAISGNAESVKRRLRTALERWRKIARKKKYRNEPVPPANEVAPPEADGKPLLLRVFLRDLPRGRSDRSGRRFTKADHRGTWLDFTKWAWNVNWITFDDPRIFVPRGKKEQPVDDAAFRRLCRRVLVDNVRGQTPRWRDEEVEAAKLTMRRVKTEGPRWHIEYRGNAAMNAGSRSYRPTLLGRSIWHSKKGHFEKLDIVAVGERAGAARFNQRSRDTGPAPMGVALVLRRDTAGEDR